MSDDFPSDTSPEPTEPGTDPTALRRPKRRHRRPDEPEAADAVGADAMTLLNAFLRDATQREQDDDQTNAPRSRFNRLPARDEAADAAAAIGTPAPPGKWTPSPDQGGGTPEAAVTVKLRSVRSGEPVGRNRAQAWHQSPWVWGIFCVVLIAAVAATAFLTGRRDAHRALSAPWSPAFADQWARAHAAEQAGDLAVALFITQDVAAHVNLDPLSRVYQASLKTRLGFTVDADTDLVHLRVPGLSPDMVTAINAARGFNLVRARKFDLASDCFAEVAKSTPADVSNLLNWAESLRRNGRCTDAADKFEAVLARVPAAAPPYVEAQREYIAYERRLTLVEAGRLGELSHKLDQPHDMPAARGYWLLTAAAVALQQQDVPAAVDALKKAQAVFTPGQFGTLLADYFFRSFSYHPEISAFQTPASPEQAMAKRLGTDYFIDP